MRQSDWRYLNCGRLDVEERKNHADLIETFKLIKGLSTVLYSLFFELDKKSQEPGDTGTKL